MGLGQFFKETRGLVSLPPPPLSGPKLKPEDPCWWATPTTTEHPRTMHVGQHKESPSTMVGLQRGSFVILLSAPQSCSKLITATDFKESSELAYAPQGTAQGEKQAE